MLCLINANELFLWALGGGVASKILNKLQMCMLCTFMPNLLNLAVKLTEICEFIQTDRQIWFNIFRNACLAKEYKCC